MYNVLYWDAQEGIQKTRAATDAEVVEIEALRQGGADVPLAESIPMLNLHLVLIEDGHLATVEATIQSMPGEAGQRARAYWAKALTARRDNEWVNLLWPDLYGNETAFNEAWARAAALQP